MEGTNFFISEMLRGEYVGLAEVGARLINVDLFRSYSFRRN